MFPLKQFGRKRKGAAGLESGGGGAKLGFRPEEDDDPDRRDPPVSDSEGARARRTGPTWAEEERERFWADFRPKAKRDFLKPFSI